MSRTLAEQANDASEGGLKLGVAESQLFTLSAFAWGGVWYQTFAAVFSSAACRDVLQAAAKAATKRGASGPGVVVLGSSIGFEAYFLALTFGVPTLGVELLPALVDLSDAVRLAHDVPSSLVSFQCADALDFAIPPSATMVYVDDTAWDAPTIARLAERLAQRRRGTLVIHNTPYGASRAFKRVAAIEVGTSWDAAHTIYVDQVA